MEPKLNILLTSQQLDVIANALGQRPYVEVAALLTDLSEQVRQAQNQASPPTETANPS
jgi:hypothetical protein